MKNKAVKYILFLIVLALISIGFYFVYKYNTIYPTPLVKEVLIDETGKMTIKFETDKKPMKNDKIYCGYSVNENEKEIKWTLTNNNECNIELFQSAKYKIYLKNEKNEIIYVENSENYGKVLEIRSNKDKIYLAIGGSFTPRLTIKNVGHFTNNTKWSSENEKIASVSDNGEIKGISKGNTRVTASIDGKSTTIDVVVTDLIITRPKTFNKKKSYLPCDKYNKEENDLLDEILKDRINDAGYKTRAGVVEAARFLALEFPYKIRYFSENGRLATNGVDGEGRYYHTGLYLDESRFKDIKKSKYGPQTWGCQLYSGPSHGKRSNGFDCSGFVSWVLLNGGFDVGDIGAGLASHLDLTDYGKRTKTSTDLIKQKKIKVGDLLSSEGPSGGHIAIIVGEDDNTYYVAESLWTSPNVAVVIIGYPKKTIFNRYYWVMLMDDYYKEDGNLTSLWY